MNIRNTFSGVDVNCSMQFKNCGKSSDPLECTILTVTLINSLHVAFYSLKANLSHAHVLSLFSYLKAMESAMWSFTQDKKLLEDITALPFCSFYFVYQNSYINDTHNVKSHVHKIWENTMILEDKDKIYLSEASCIPTKTRSTITRKHVKFLKCEIPKNIILNSLITCIII